MDNLGPQWIAVLCRGASSNFMRNQHPLFEYNPNYGYEPYWADGEWVLTTERLSPGVTTTKPPLVCGEECHYLWRRIKHVCGRISDYTNAHGCWDGGGLYCSGKPGDNLNHGFKTYDTYCEFLDAQCKGKFYDRSRLIMVHVGKCKDLEKSFYPLWESWQPVSRMKFFLSSLGPLEEETTTNEPETTRPTKTSRPPPTLGGK